MKSLIYVIASILFLNVGMQAQAPRLSAGENAPNFKFEDVHGEKDKFKKVIKEHDKTLLVFLRHAWCPVCNVRTHELIDNYKALEEQGIAVVVVYQSPQKTLINFVNDYQLPYTVIADPEGVLYQTYLVERNLEKVAKNATGHKKTLGLLKKGVGLYNKGAYTDYLNEGEKETADIIPADFLIDQSGEIKTAYYGEYLGDHLPIEQVLKPAAPQPKPSSKANNHVRF